MNKGQEQFYHFILDCVPKDKEEFAKAMLLECFRCQYEGTFTKEDLKSFHTELIHILKPERKEEVIAILKQFGNAHVSE